MRSRGEGERKERVESRLIIGTSCLGNLYRDIGYPAKKEIIQEVLTVARRRRVEDGGAPTGSRDLIFDSAGKYGCGLALEMLGKILKELQVPPDEIRISNKLGWKRVEMNNGSCSSCANMEPGVWVNLEYDAEMYISYDGILECFHEGNTLLGDYSASLVSVHDPDDYLKEALDKDDMEQRRNNILGAYQCLIDLKLQKQVDSIGIGVKDPSIIEYLLNEGVILDWTMIAGVLTPYVHTVYIQTLLQTLRSKNIQIFNAAVFNSGFLVGEPYFNYALINEQNESSHFIWRRNFFLICERHNLSPAHVCVQFSFLFPEIQSVALNACKLEHVDQNFNFIYEIIPRSHMIWKDLADAHLIKINEGMNDKVS